METGVSYETVRRARTDTNVSVEKRVGRDGKLRPATQPKRKRKIKPKAWPPMSPEIAPLGHPR